MIRSATELPSVFNAPEGAWIAATDHEFDCEGDLLNSAAYIYFAAQIGKAWIETPGTPIPGPCSGGGRPSLPSIVHAPGTTPNPLRPAAAPVTADPARPH